MMMNIKESYIFIFKALCTYWGKNHNLELGDLLTGLDPRVRKDKMPLDEAAWNDWINAVKKITPFEQISEEQAIQAMLLLLKEYGDQGFNLDEVIKHFSNPDHTLKG